MLFKKYEEPKCQIGHVSYSPLFNSIDDLLNQASFDRLSSSYSSRLKFDEVDSHYQLSIDLPGYSSKDINTSIEDYILTVIAKNEKRGETVRTVVLWDGIDFDKVSGKIEDGILTIKLPKLEKVKPKKIKID
jgi:HSP20 family protein